MGRAVIVGGDAIYANGVLIHRAGVWDGCGYSGLYDPWPIDTNNPASPAVGYVAENSGATLVAGWRGFYYVAGGFLKDLNRDGHGDIIAQWDGNHWRPMWFKIASSYISPRCLVAGPSGVYFGGSFLFMTSSVPEAPRSFCIAKWDGQGWTSFGEGIRDEADTTNTVWPAANVFAIAEGPSGEVYAAGEFRMPTSNGVARHVARWDGTQWLPLGSGLAGRWGRDTVTRAYAAVCGPGGELYVGGSFSNAGGVGVSGVARWDRNGWTNLGAGVGGGGTVHALAWHDGRLYAGGDFLQAGGKTVRYIACWDGTNWWPVGTGTAVGAGGGVASLASGSNGLYVGGYFTSMVGQPAQYIARYGIFEPPTAIAPAPITVSNAAPDGADVVLAPVIGHPCGFPLTVTWNVDGGPAEWTNIVEGANPPMAVLFTNHYPVGVHPVTITVSDGGRTPPLVCNTRVIVLAPATALLLGSVTDDGLPVGITNAVWTQVTGPVAAVLHDPHSPSTLASFSEPGTYVFRLTGDDTEYTAWDEMTVHITPMGATNYPPSVNAGPDQQVMLGHSAALTGVVTDDGLPTGSEVRFQWSEVSGPGTASFDCATCAVTAVSFTEPGIYILRLIASDGQLEGHDVVVITVAEDLNQPPSVNAGADRVAMFAEGKPLVSVPLDTTVTDDGLPCGLLTKQWSLVSGPSSALFRYRDGQYYAVFGAPGTYTLRLTASDGQYEASDDVTVTILTFVPPPLMEITSPTNTQQVTAPSRVIGTISSPILASWRLEYRMAPSDSSLNSASYTILATGSTPVTDGELGTLDPTLALNGTYEFRLIASDLAGRTATSETYNVVFDKNMKVGLFTLSFEDLSIPLAGIPIQVIRTYDSRAALAGRQGDFGVGWTLSLKDLRLQKNRPLGTRWYQEIVGFSALGLPVYEMTPKKDRVVTVTLPDNAVYRFKAVFSPARQTGVPIVSGNVVFEPLPGTYGTLHVEGGNAVQVVGDVPYYDPFGGPSVFSGYVDLMDLEDAQEFEPVVFRLTTQDGTSYVVHQADGLQRVYDLNGNEVQYTANGIFHSSGQSVQFLRDTQGRITRILDPAGHALTYGYSTNNDLIAFTDRTTNTTFFSYAPDPSNPSDSSHLLRDIFDPRGVRAVRSEYDSSGRLIRQTDAEGNPINFTHDIENRREIITDRLGHVTIHEYDDRGNVVKTIDALTNITTRTYDDLDNEITTTDPLGKTSTYSYDSRGNKLSESDPLGNTTRYTYNSFGQPLTITDPKGNATRYTYDARGNLLTEQDALGHVTTYTYDHRGNMLTRTDALGNVTSNEYDTLGRLVRTIQPVAGPGGPEVVTVYTYDANGNRLTEARRWTTPTGTTWLVTSNLYDNQNRLIATIHPDGSVTRIEYNAIGKESARVDPLGRRTEYEYDARGNLVVTRYADGSSETNYYDAENRKIASADRMGRVTSYVYDPLGRLTDTIYPACPANGGNGAMVSSIYDELGRVVASFDANGNQTQYEYDPNCGCPNRRAKVIDALGHETTFEYDENGNQTAMHDANGHTTRFTYDALNRQTVVTFHDGTTKVTTYDALGRRVAETDQAGLTTQYRYDGLGRLTNVVDALGQVTRYEYDEVGNLIRQTDANGHTTTFEYDSMGRRIKRTLPEGQVETYAYDLAGNMTNKVDFNGKVTTYAYDAMNRLLSKQPDASFNASNIVFTYSASGQRLSMADQSGVTTYRYDERDRLVEKRTPVGSLFYGYDLQGNLTNISAGQVPGLEYQVSYTYDPLNRLKTVNDPRSGLTLYSYDPVGNLKAYTYPNGVTHFYEYDGLNRLTNLTVNALTNPIARYAYTLNPSGHRTAVRELSGRTVSYGYDNLYRLTRETISGSIIAGQISYTYDAVGNRLERQSTVGNILAKLYTYDMNDRLGSDTYDANGNTVGASVAGGGDPGALFTYAYDFENRIVSVTSVSSVVHLLYDGDGNRVAKTVDGVIIRYLVDDRNPTGYSQVLAELDASNNVVVTYTYGLDQISQNQVRGTNWVRSFYGYDGHGNVRFLTDEDGQITDTYDYDAFGTLIIRSGTTANNYLYCGEQFDPDLGLYFLRARYMDTDRGRFWTMDPFEGILRDPPSLHKYLYVQDDPVNAIDPRGLSPIVDITVAQTIDAKTQESLTVVKVQTTRKTIEFFICKGTRSSIEHMHHWIPVFLGGVAVAAGATGSMPANWHMDFHRLLHYMLRFYVGKGGMGPGSSAASWSAVFAGAAGAGALTGPAAQAAVYSTLLAAASIFDSACAGKVPPVTPEILANIAKGYWKFVP